MPELPDVEIFSAYFRKKGLKHKIRSVEVTTPRILKKVSKKQLEKALVNRHFLSVKRKGKYLFVKISDGSYLVIHFGMTGFLYAFKDENPFKKYSRVVWQFQKGQLAYVNLRLLGFITLTPSIEAFTQKLGPDALTISKADFRALFERGSLKTILMDQQKIAGIGNIYSDEILFQAGFSPKRKGASLSSKEVDKLFTTMKRVLKRAIEVGADIDRMPRSWQIPERRKGATCPRCGRPIHRVPMGGRSSYYCTHCQT